MCTRKCIAAHQREVIGVDPDDAEVREVSVVPSHLLQDLQKLKAIFRIDKKK